MSASVLSKLFSVLAYLVRRGVYWLVPNLLLDTAAPGEPFWPPIYNPYEQTPDEWRRLVHVELEEYLDELLKSCQASVNIGLGEPAELPKQRRNRAASVNERYEWAALRLMGQQWLKIGARYRDCSTAVDIDRAVAAVRKTATDILRRARLKPTGNKKPSS
jgi:hypothetical protein